MKLNENARLLLCWIVVSLLVPVVFAADPSDEQFFESKVRPLLTEKCFTCHSGDAQMGGLNLSTAEGFYKGAASGPVFSAQHPEASRLLEVISYQDKIKMPPTGRLSDEEIGDLTTWIRKGAPWPGAKPPQPVDTASGPQQMDDQYWWSEPPRQPVVPAVRNKDWVQKPVDNFILAKLEAEGLTPAEPADKLVLLRRATYDLTGLPPTSQEIEDFLADSSPDAFARVVDRLLESPRYGERWGRHWLDVARYADSNGLTNDRLYPYAWRYRDYVIEAFNQDLPYDRFVMEQIAGDLLPAEKPGEVNKNGIIATGFLALGPKPFVQQDKVQMIYDTVDEQIDVTSRAFMGLTVACARCHDHKFDAIPTRDYYSMVAIFAATRTFSQIQDRTRAYVEPLVPKDVYEPYERHQRRIADKQRQISDLIYQESDRYTENLQPMLASYMVAARRVADGESLESAARQADLDPEILKKWVAYLQADGPEAGHRPHLEQWQQAKDDEIEKVAAIYQARFDASAERWKEQAAEWKKQRDAAIDEGLAFGVARRFRTETPEDRFFGDVAFDPGPFGFPEKRIPGQLGRGVEEEHFPPSVRDRLASLRHELEGLEQSSPPQPPMASAVSEGEPVEQHVLLRGNYKNPGERVPPGFPSAAVGDTQPEIQHGSGRLELARWLASPDNLLTARVMVNRIWQWHFGEGLVRTPNNFGRMGELPTHRELLDYLAVRFVKSGWSIKQMNRLIMLSSAYQMSSTVKPNVRKADPGNRLWSHFSRRRLDIEEIRDSMLAFEGSLDLKMGGTLLDRGRPAGSGDSGEGEAAGPGPTENTRRTVYLPIRRGSLWPLLSLFDFGDAATTTPGRATTNVAPQALFMMNSEFVNERAAGISKKLLAEAPEPARFVGQAYLTVLGREPDSEELSMAVAYMEEASEQLAPGAPAQETRFRAAQSLARLLLGSNEFMYLD